MRTKPPVVVAVLLLAGGCGSGADQTAAPPTPAAMTALPGTDAQRGEVGQPAPLRPGVVLRTATGAPVGGVRVVFRAGPDAGATSGDTAITDATGTARIGSWTAATRAGRQQLVASAAGLPDLTFTLDAQSAPPAQFRARGSRQQRPAGTVTTEAPAVIVLDRFGNPVRGLLVRWRVTVGNGTIERDQSLTDSLGRSTPGAWRLDAQPGPNALVAITDDVTVLFTADGLPDAPAALEWLTSTAWTMPIRAPLPEPLRLRVRDRNGQPVPGATLRALPTGTLELADTTVRTDSTGVATVIVTASPTTAGSTRLVVSSDGIESSAVTIRTIDPATTTTVALSAAGSCAIASEGVAFCWGDNLDGRLGDGTRTSRLQPVGVIGGISLRALASDDRSACALTTSDGALVCWGANEGDRLGTGVSGPASWRPAPVRTPLRFVALEAFNGSVQRGFCARTAEGQLYCWGTSGASTGFVRIEGGPPFTQLTLGAAHACALDGEGRAYCWGSNRRFGVITGQLGDSVGLDRAQPTPVVTPVRFRALAAGAYTTCGLSLEDEVWCWGANDGGQLGDSTTVQRSIPTRVRLLRTVAAITNGSDHACALRTDGTAWCWGRNFAGQLGSGSISGTPSLVPIAVASELRFTTLDAGDFHTCARTTDARLTCWGGNFAGQLGDGTRINRPRPTAVLY